MKTNPFQARNLKRQLLAVTVIASALLTFLGYIYYGNEEKIIRDDKYNELNVIAELKINQILQWRNERLVDANVITQSTIFQNAVETGLTEKNNLAIRRDILDQLSIIKAQYGYDEVFIVSPEGDVVLSLDPGIKYPCSVSINTVRKALEQKTAVFTDFYFCNNQILIDVIAPVTDNKNKPIAALIFQINPSIYLYPLIQTWPTNSKTAETLLIRKDGDSVLFVNELRHVANSALKLRIALTSVDVPAVQAVLGKVGIFEGNDYRGIEVLSDVRPVPGTPWFMVAKVDKSEIYVELYYRAFVSLILVTLMIFLCGATLSWIYHSRQNKTYKELLLAEKKLDLKEDEFRTALYSIGDGIITTDLNGCVRQMNSVAEQLTGWTELNANGKKLDEVFRIINEETRKTVENPVEKVLREGLIVGLANHTLLVSVDGKETPIADSGAPIKTDTGEIGGVVLVFRDQSAERDAELRLRESERKFRNVFEHSVVGISTTSMDGQLKTNNAFCHILGYTEAELSHMKWQQITYADDIEYNKKIISSIISGEKETARWEKRYIHKNGSIIWVDISTSLLRDSNNNPLYFITTINDITERKLAEIALRDEKDRIRTILNLVGDPIFVKDNDHRIILANRAFYDIFKLDENNVIGYTLVEAVPENERKHFLKVDRSVLDTGISDVREEELTVGETKHFIITRKTRFVDESGNRFLVGSIHNITERRKAEDALRESRAKLDAALASMTDAVFISDNEGQFIEFNDAFASFHRFSKKSECLTWLTEFHDILDVYFPNGELAPLEMWAVPRALRGETVTNAEYTLQRKDTGEKWVGSYSFSPIRGENGAIVGSVVVGRDITQIKQSSELLRETNEYLQNLFNYANAPIIVWDDQFKITRFNNAFAELSGYSPAEVTGERVDILFPKDKVESSVELINRAAGGTRWETVEIEILRKDGEIRIVLWNSANIFNETRSEIIATIAQGNDITERKKAEEAVLTSQKLLKEITDNSLSLIYALDYQGRFLLINSALESLFGVPRETLLGKTREAIMPAEIAALHRANDLKVMNDRIPIVFEEENNQSDGIHTYISIKYPLLDAQGNLIGIGGVSTDITARKQAEEDLRKHTERLRNLHLIDHAILQAIDSPESVVQTAIQHIRELLNCQRVNVGIFDLEKKEVLVYAADVDGKTIVQVGKILTDEVYGIINSLRESKMEIVEDMSMVVSPSLINMILQAEGIQSYINMALVSELEMYGVLNIGWEKSRTISTEETDIAGEVANQITIAIEKARLLKKTKSHASELEERVRVRTNQLLAANKELETFTYSVSHDLKAPLRGIDGYSKLLLDLHGKDLNEEARTFIATIRSSTLQMNQLIDDLLEYSRLERSQKSHEIIKIKDLISSIASLYKDELNSGKYLVKIEVPDIELIADTKGLTIALRNIFANAVKFTGGNPGPTIEIGLEELATSWKIWVKDNGIGFDMKYHQRIFEIFQRLHRAEDFPGTGIGLAMVNKAMQRMNGRVWAESKPEVGSVFYLEIPKTN